MNNQFVLGWGLITAAFFGGATFAWAAESIGGAEIVVNEVKGNLTAGKVVSVLRGDDVYREEGVKTSADSTAKLVLRDNTILTVGPGSFVKLDKFVYDHPGSAGAISLNLTKGTLRFVTGLALKSSYSVTTPTAALGLRGTIFTLEATRIKTTVTLNEGAMDVCMKAFRHKCVILDHPGQQATVTATVVALVPDPLPLLPLGVSWGLFLEPRLRQRTHRQRIRLLLPLMVVLPPQRLLLVPRLALERLLLVPRLALERLLLVPRLALERLLLVPRLALERLRALEHLVGDHLVGEGLDPEDLDPVGRATVKATVTATASARVETTGMATTVTGLAMGMAMGTGTGTVLATAAEMDTEIA